MTTVELLEALDRLQAMMISVATGGPRIDDENGRFGLQFREVHEELLSRGITARLPYENLWDWRGRWTKGDLPSWQSRREFINGIFEPIARQVGTGAASDFEPTGWTRIDRTIKTARQQLLAAASEENFQTVGLLCREALITLGQEVWDVIRHPSVDGVLPSGTDARRRLEAYIAVELATGANEEARRHARGALALAVALQHRRTANFRDAAMCLEGTTSVINLVAIIEGRRDPTD